MAAEDLNLTGVRSLNQAMARTPNGTAAIELARRLGLWTDNAHSGTLARPPFPGKLSELAPSELSDLYSTWTAEYGRIIELCGAISGQEALLRIQTKSSLAAARGRVRRSVPEGARAPSQQALTDAAEEDPTVIDIIEQSGLLSLLNAHAGAAKEATMQYLATISREISFRDAQMKARIY